MTFKRFFLVLSCIFLLNISNAFAYQKAKDTTNQSEDQKLPSKQSVFEDSTKVSRNTLTEYNEAYFLAGRWNEGITFPPEDINLQSPQATLEYFIVQARNKNFDKALYALNFNLLPDSLNEEDAAVLAQKLFFVLEQQVAISWDALPDRPDGQIDMTTSTNKSVAGKPRRSILFGKSNLDERDVVFRLQRVKYKDKSPVWLISSQTVENIEPLYKVYGPRKLDRMIPKWISFEILSIPVWKVIGTIILVIIAFFISKMISYIIRKLFSGTEKYWIKNIAYRLASPAGAAVGILAFYLLLNNLISFTGPFARGLYTIILISLIGIITWLIMRVIDYIMDFFAEHKVGDLESAENSQAKRLMTYISVGRRIFIFVVVLVGGSIIFSQFPSLEKMGISLMASAGIATVVVGIAAQSTLGNIIAGVQIAITKPAKIGDAVIIDGSYGFVEDITFTFMVLKTWDLRRKVIPLKTVISESFENLSMTNSQKVGEIELFLDHTIDVSKVRSKFAELVKNSEDWDGDEDRSPVVQVCGMDGKYLKIRCLVSAKDFPTSWDLHCKLREELVSYIGELGDGKYLVKDRVELEEGSGETSKD